jgi:hypothetical protein
MALPNLVSLLLLSPVVVRLSQEYWAKHERERQALSNRGAEEVMSQDASPPTAPACASILMPCATTGAA